LAGGFFFFCAVTAAKSAQHFLHPYSLPGSQPDHNGDQNQYKQHAFHCL
jgi:hypothetical protein